MIKLFLKKVIGIIFFSAHILFKKLGVLNFINIYGVGEKNSYRINPFISTIDVSDSDNNLILTKDSKLPIISNTARIIYSAHNLEHLPLEVVNNYFANVYECLIESGELLLELPDAKICYNIYKSGNWLKLIPELSIISYHDYFKINIDDRPYQSFLNVLVTYIDPPFFGEGKSVNITEIEFNNKFNELNMEEFFEFCTGLLSSEQSKSGGHVTIWYPEKIIRILANHGFNAKIRGYKESSTLGFLGKTLIPDRKHRSFYSFRISAVKS